MNKKIFRKNIWIILILIVIPLIFAQQDIPPTPAQEPFISATQEILPEPKFEGYIIQFQEEPVLEKKAELESDIQQRESELAASSPLYKYTLGQVKRVGIAYSKSRKSSRIRSQRDRILQEHSAALADIQARVPSITGHAVASQQNTKLPNEFTDVFNGISLNITTQEAEQLKQSPYVKTIYPNYRVNITLMDSVPLINVDDVWQLDKDGNDCSITGKECLTGKDITIAIIDTGVDYTHPDLGGTGEKVFFPVYPRKIDIDENNNLVYWADSSTNQINYINLTDNTTGTVISKDMYKGGNVLALDNINNRIYWLKEECFDPGCFWTSVLGIVSSDLSGENIQIIRVPEVYEDGEKEGFTDVKVDLVNEKIYWMASLQYIYPIKFVRNDIKRANLDGSNVETVVSSLSNNTQIFDIAIDNVNNKIYWAEPLNGRVMRANLDGSNIEIVISEPGTQIRVVTLDTWNNKIYFGGTGKIKRANLDGSNVEIIRYLKNPFRNPSDLEINFNEGKIYWIEESTIERANLDGSNYEEDIFEGVKTPGFGCEDCKVIGGYDFVNNDNNPMDDQGHGTHCAGIAAGNGTLKGVAPDAKIYAYKVLSSGGGGYSDWIIAGIERAVDPNQDTDFSDHVDIISMSLGGYGDPDDPMSQAVDTAVNNGVVAVIAAGNLGPGYQTIGSPGTARKAITVGASDKTDNIAYFSSRGPVIWPNGIIIKPDIIAPGVDICAAQWNDAFLKYGAPQCVDTEHVAISGTSMATPHVAGAAALIKQKNPTWTPNEIKAALKSTSIDIRKDISTQGYGRIDVLNAVRLDEPPEMPWDFYAYTDSYINNVYDQVIIKGIFPEDYDSLIVEEEKTRSSKGIEIIGREGVIAEFNPEEIITESTTYDFTVKIEKGGVTKTIDYKIYFDKDLKKGWPKTIFSSDLSFLDQPTIVDVDNDGNKDILITYSEDGSISPNLLVYNYKGDIINSLSISGSSAQFGAIYSDFDKDNNPDVLLINTIASEGWERYLNIFNPSSNTYSLIHVPTSGFGTILSNDLDLDGFNEIFFVDWDSYLYFYSNLSSDFNFWSKPLFNLEDCISVEIWRYRNYCRGASSSDIPFYLNLDNDPEFEILSTSYSIKTNKTTIYAFNLDGSVVNEFPKRFDFPLWCVMQGKFHDDTQIACIKYDSFDNIENINLYLIDEDFNFVESEEMNFKDLISERFNIFGMSFGNFNDEDYFVLIIRDNFNYKNFVVFISAGDLRVNKIYNLPLLYNHQFYPIGNFNGKNYIFAGSTYEGTAYFINLDGDQLQIPHSKLVWSAVISDIDGDSLNELISFDWDGKVYVRDLTGESEKEWGEFFYDPQHTNL
ncbi:S8 family serine peptidase, partial [Candidatus Woesearchaeota archaeon]|nr:S8 family serine peptidase [Candidatus Woesearchaeota archaeon]